MTNLATIQIKTIQAMLESLDPDDEDDARQAVKLIKALLGIEAR